MAIGPGKYDDLCTFVRTLAKADGAITVIFNGEKGSGFSAQLPLDLTMKLPQLLRHMADDIESNNLKPGNVGITSTN